MGSAFNQATISETVVAPRVPPISLYQYGELPWECTVALRSTSSEGYGEQFKPVTVANSARENLIG